MNTQQQLRPFYPYYGSKWRDAPYYPPPIYDTIIEPFAGGAGYSVRHAARNIILIERDPVVAGLWRWLIEATADEIHALPNIVEGQTTDDLDVRVEARHLIGWWINKSTSSPCKRMSKWMRLGLAGVYKGSGGNGPTNWWGPEIRARIASQLPAIRHWKIIEGSYADAPDIEASWFVDPPYQRQGKYYRHGAKGIDFGALAAWCRTRRGQTIVCEQEGADWLPFAFHRDVKSGEGTNGRKRSREVVWISNNVGGAKGTNWNGAGTPLAVEATAAGAGEGEVVTRVTPRLPARS